MSGETRFNPFYELFDMTATISITCPSCKKRMTGPAAALGKKVKCKACSHVFVAQEEGAAVPAGKGAAKAGAPAPAAKPGPPANAKPKAPPAASKQEVDKNRMLDPDDLEPDKGYGFEEQPADVVARCPQCAYELESADAVVCLTCGYNLLTRIRLRTQKTYEMNTMDWVKWYTPTVGAALGCLASIVFGIFLWTGFGWWFGDWWFYHFSVQIWFTVFACAGAWYSGKFVFKRLVYQPRPPEKVKRD
jgi:hypothetical protein